MPVTLPGSRTGQLRNRAHDYVYVQNNARHLRFVGTTDWFGRAVAAAGADRALYPLLRADARARRLLRQLESEVGRERAHLLPGRASLVTSATDAASAEALLSRLLTRVGDPVTRRRLARAWRVAATGRQAAASAILDELAELRRSAARAVGAMCPADVSRLEDSTLPGAGELTALVDSYARGATVRGQLLAEAVGAEADDPEALTDYPVYVKRRMAGLVGPELDVARAIELATRIAEACVDGPVDAVWSPHHVLLSLRDQPGLLLGHIQFDLSTGSRTACAESTEKGPLGRALVRYALSAGRPVMSYNAFFLFIHEVGHALTHVLRSARSVYRGPWAGLEYAPVLHTESVSTLTEKLALHQDLASWFGVASGDRSALKAWQGLSALGFLRNEAPQVAVARVDDQLHGPDGRKDCSLGTGDTDASSPQAWLVAPYVVTQLLARYPGVGSIAYLVANTYSCNIFDPLRKESFEVCLSSIATEVASVLRTGLWPSPLSLDTGPVSAVYLPALTEESYP